MRSPEVDIRLGLVRANAEINRIAKETFTASSDVFKKISEIVDTLQKIYTAAQTTVETTDDETVKDIIENASTAFATVINNLNQLDGNVLSDGAKDLLKNFFDSKIQLAKAIGATPFTSTSRSIAENLLQELEAAKSEEGGIFSSQFAASIAAARVKLDQKINSSEQVAEFGKKTELISLLDPILEKVKKSTIAGGDRDELDSWLTKAEEVAAAVDSHVAFKTPISDSDDESMGNFQPWIDDMKKKYAPNPAELSLLSQVELIVSQIKHEFGVVYTGARTNLDIRKLFRPSVDPSNLRAEGFPAEIDGMIQVFLGNFSNEISQTEAIARVLAALSDSQRRQILTQEQREFLETFKKRLSKYIINQQANSTSASGYGVLNPTDYGTAASFTKYQAKYIDWLDHLLFITRPIPMAPAAPILSPLLPNAEVNVFDEKLENNFAGALHDLVTLSFQKTDQVQYQSAFLRMEEKLTNAGLDGVSKMLSKATTLFEFGVYIAAGGPLKVDDLSANFKLATEKLKPEAALKCWDQLRDISLFEQTVEKISERAFKEMATEDSKWNAGKSWNNGFELIEHCFDELIKSDTNFRILINGFNTNPSIPDNIKKNLKNFFIRMSQYDASLRDLRTEAAKQSLAITKSATKHDVDPESIGPSGLAAVTAYNVAKNSDRGEYASVLGWMKLPGSILRGGKTSPTPEEKAGHEENINQRINGIKYFLGVTFSSHALHAIEHNKWECTDRYVDGEIPQFSGFTTLNEFLTLKNRQPNQRMADFLKAREGVEKIYHLASTCWEKDIDFSHDITKFSSTVTSLLKSLASNVSLAISFVSTDNDRKKSYRDSIRSACNYYIIYLLSQIKRSHTLLIDREYNKQYEEFVSIAVKLFEDNGSLVLKAQDLAPGEVTFRQSFIDTVKNKAFRKHWHRGYENNVLIPYNLNRIHNEGSHNPIKDSTQEQRKAHPEYPYKIPSDKSTGEHAK